MMQFGLDIVSESIYLHRDMDDRLRSAAKREKVPVNTLVVFALAKTLDELDLLHNLESIEHENIA